jgi:hypothetical protein
MSKHDSIMNKPIKSPRAQSEFVEQIIAKGEQDLRGFGLSAKYHVPPLAAPRLA